MTDKFSWCGGDTVLVAKPSDLSLIPRTHMRKDRYSNTLTTVNDTNTLPLSYIPGLKMLSLHVCVSVSAPVSVCTYVHIDI